jgi:dipeptidase E
MESLLKKFSSCDIIYVNGGNTFYLLNWARKSGFDKIAKKLIKTKIYFGTSAGSVITGPTIETAGWKHADRNIVNLKDLRGLNLVSFLITPHFSKEYEKTVLSEIKKTSYPVVALKDRQAILIDNNNTKIEGKGKKVFFNGFEES